MQKSKVFYIIGTGRSIEDVTSEEWEYLKDKETLSFGGFPYCGIPTKYYLTYESPNIYIKELIKNPELTKDIKLDILDIYNNKDTILLLYHNSDIELANNMGFENIIKINKKSALFYPNRQPWFTDQKDAPVSFRECRAHDFSQPLFRYRGSLSAVINSAIILGATEIRLIGIDLDSQIDFYMEDPDKWIKNDLIRNTFKNIVLKNRLKRIRNKIKEQNNYDPNEIHNTNHPYMDENRWKGKYLRPISDVIEWMDRELKSEGLSGIYITSKRSLLYKDKKLKFKGIMDD